MATISVCMIAKNEEKFLANCLNSVKDIADEIVVVDTGSTDKTVEIAKKFNAKILHHKWDNDYATPRNLALEAATKEWILVLDADELIAKIDKLKIKEIIKNKDFDGFFLTFRNYSNDQSPPNWTPNNNSYSGFEVLSGWFPTLWLRLFRNKKEIRYQKRIHETVDRSIRAYGGKIAVPNPPVFIHHYGYCKSEETMKSKRRARVEMAKEEIKLSPDDPKTYFELANLYARESELDEAIKHFKKTIELDENYQNVLGELGVSYLRNNQVDEAINYLKKAVEKEPTSGNFINLGVAYTAKSRFDEAEKAFKKAIQLNNKDVSAYNNLGALYFKKGLLKEAIEFYEISIKLSPNDSYIKKTLENLHKEIEKE